MIDHLLAKAAGSGNHKTGIAYIYCDYRDQRNQNLTNIIGSITNQLLKSLTYQDLNSICEEIKIEEEMEQNQVNLNFTMRMLKLTLKMFDHTFICLDAIDELEMKTQSTFMQSVQNILKGTPNFPGGISFCFTARPHVRDIVTEILGKNSQSGTITANDDDIRKYILHELACDLHPKLMNDDLKEQLLIEIPMNSRGMYVIMFPRSSHFR